MKEHLIAYEERTGRKHPHVLNAPRLPDGCRPLWDIFAHLHNRRETGMGGVSRISDRQIMDCQDLHGVRLSAWELTAISKADDAYLDWRAES